ncbi:MAG: hypothetical protein ACI9VT_002675 [Psychroserpens sp.]|jgi:hypothetical protein
MNMLFVVLILFLPIKIIATNIVADSLKGFGLYKAARNALQVMIYFNIYY